MSDLFQLAVPENPCVRIKLRRVHCDYHAPCPSPGREKIWWDRLKTALGTKSIDFVNATLKQIQGASRMPTGELSETTINAVLAFIEGAEPKNEVEAALATQMGCVHAVTMTVLSRLGGSGGANRSSAMAAGAAAKLARTFAVQAETLRRLKNGAKQFVRVEHVHVNEGGQAVIGNINARRAEEVD